MIGAIIGDIEGSIYEFNNIKTKDFDIYNPECIYTDDTIMTLACMEIIQNKWTNDEGKIIDTLKKWARAYPGAGYGGFFYFWMTSEDRKPYDSCGNGSAMRVSPAGFYANSEKEAIELASAITKVTHNHPEGMKGAIVTAMCIYLARIGKSKEEIKKYASEQYPEILSLDYEELRKTYYHKDEICQLTVPQAIYCFLISTSFEDCIRTTISIGGDCDTTAAISCAIAEAYYKNIDQSLIDYAIAMLPERRGDCNPHKIVMRYLEDRNNRM